MKNDKEPSLGARPLLKILVGDSVKEVTYEELVLSNNLAQEALVRLLIEKKVIDPNEYWNEMQKVREERYRDEKDIDLGEKK